MTFATGCMAAALIATAFGPAPTVPAAPSSDATSVDGRAELAARVGRLIEQLGAPDFAIRERAQAELGKIGMEAFDAVFQAQEHDDIEIALRARHLVRSMRVGWVRDDDPADVKAILEPFPGQELEQRAESVEQLAKLPSGRGTSALCRIARFDAAILLSKRAALLVMQQTLPEDAAARKARARQISAATGLSRRVPVEWLRAHAQTLGDPEKGADRWPPLIEAEQRVLARRPDQTKRAIVRDLVRYRADMLRDLGRKQQALAAMYDSLDWIGAARTDLDDAIQWLTKRGAWPVIDRLSEKFPGPFRDDAALLYVLAESAAEQGNAEKAQTIAGQAFDLSDVDGQEQEGELRLTAGYALQQRGRVDWALRELRRAVQVSPVKSSMGLRTRGILASLLHDQQLDREAAETLQPLVELIDTDTEFARRIAPYLQMVGSYKSRMHYYLALDFARHGEREKQSEHLDRAIAADPADADVLIGMYRIPNPSEAYREKTLRLIREAAEKFEKNIAVLRTMRVADPDRTDFNLSIAYNQYAWLVGNTEGDTQKALDYSKKSNALRPESGGLLDTLGRCYYAAGDLENAVTEQTRAAELEPGSAVIRRQLEFFQQELAKSKAAGQNP